METVRGEEAFRTYRWNLEREEELRQEGHSGKEKLRRLSPFLAPRRPPGPVLEPRAGGGPGWETSRAGPGSTARQPPASALRTLRLAAFSPTLCPPAERSPRVRTRPLHLSDPWVRGKRGAPGQRGPCDTVQFPRFRTQATSPAAWRQILAVPPRGMFHGARDFVCASAPVLCDETGVTI